MRDTLNGISIFVHAAGAESFTKAADQLGLSRSAVGKAIARLESRLNTRLFHRTTRGQSLTDRGQKFYERCLVVVAEMEAAEAVLDADATGPSGILRVSAPLLLGRQCVAPILIDFTQQYQELELDLRFSDHIVDLVEDRIDLAIRIGPLPDRAGHVARKLGSFDMVVCASYDYLCTRGQPTSLEELAGHDCLPFTRGGGRPEPWRFTSPNGPVLEYIPSGRIRLNDLQAIVDATLSGAGVACLPAWLVRDRIRDNSLTPLMVDHRAVGNDVFAVRAQAPHVLTKVRTAVSELVKRMPSQLGA